LDSLPDPIKAAADTPDINVIDNVPNGYMEPSEEALHSYMDSFALWPDFKLLMQYTVPLTV